MKIFSWLYALMLQWARHQYAPRYLAFVSFIESFFFPIPPDVMLVPMSLAKPQQALNFAGLATIFSVLGGIFGYLLGLFALQWLLPLIMASHYKVYYLQAVDWFGIWGVWVIMIAAVAPIPYKIFTITAGMLTMPFLPFVLASTIGRGLRFYLVAVLLHYQGARIEKLLAKCIDWIGWILVVILVLLYLYYH
ncbi:MAG: DedA family protein [Legionellaceae bacterium]|nr:DedA family protein [Legionellaceae bacterium]